MKIERVILEGFKSFRERTEVPLGSLTLLAGANSSGKSTIMQTLLLMKQTLESGFDPGPLLISGQNVVFSNTGQMFWSAPGERRDQITLGLKISEEREKAGYEVQLERQKGAATPLQIVRAVIYKDEASVTLSPALTAEQQASYEKRFQQGPGKRLPGQWGENLDVHFEVQRDRFFSMWMSNLSMLRAGKLRPTWEVDFWTITAPGFSSSGQYVASFMYPGYAATLAAPTPSRRSSATSQASSPTTLPA